MCHIHSVSRSFAGRISIAPITLYVEISNNGGDHTPHAWLRLLSFVNLSEIIGVCRPQYEVRKVRDLRNDYTSYKALVSLSNVRLFTVSNVISVNDTGIPPIFQGLVIYLPLSSTKRGYFWST